MTYRSKPSNVGKCLQVAQILKNVKSADLAAGLGVAPQQVVRWRSASNMRLHTVQEIASYLGMSLDEFCSLDK